MKHMDRMETWELLELFTQAAQHYEEALENASVKEANRNTSIGDRVIEELERRGAKDELLALLDHPTPIVRGRAAAYALRFAPEAAVPVLESNMRNLRGIPAAHARTALLVWKDESEWFHE